MINIICAYNIYLGVLSFQVPTLPKMMLFHKNQYSITVHVDGTPDELQNWAIVEKDGRRLMLPLECKSSGTVFEEMRKNARGV